MNDNSTQQAAPAATSILSEEVELAVTAAEQVLPAMLAALAAGGYAPAGALLKFLPALPFAIKAAETVANAEGVHIPDAVQGVINTLTPGAPGAPSLN